MNHPRRSQVVFDRALLALVLQLPLRLERQQVAVETLAGALTVALRSPAVSESLIQIQFEEPIRYSYHGLLLAVEEVEDSVARLLTEVQEVVLLQEEAIQAADLAGDRLSETVLSEKKRWGDERPPENPHD